MALQPADLLHADRRGSRPIARLGRNGERRHCTALAARVGDVEVDGYELRLARHVAVCAGSGLKGRVGVKGAGRGEGRGGR
eukprot:58221-Chlamydomonas_euryale.AAC.2